MKTSRLKLITTITAAVLTAGAILLLVVCYRDRGGTVTNPRHLPRFGPALPSLETGPLEYEYNPRIERVLARGHASTNAFSTICAQLKLETIEYEDNFPRGGFISESPSSLQPDHEYGAAPGTFTRPVGRWFRSILSLLRRMQRTLKAHFTYRSSRRRCFTNCSLTLISMQTT